MEPIAESPANWKWRYPVFEIKPAPVVAKKTAA
jgi:Na+-translocating ferredoxin:NAD+ oxidoreductase subunit B